MSRNHLEESGFSLIELMITFLLIAILTGLSVQSYIIHREKSYYTVSEQALLNARKSLEAGLINSDEFTTWTSLWQDTPGAPKTAKGRLLAPGLVVPDASVVYVRHKPDCEDEWCIEDYVYARHCKADRYLYWYRYRNGREWTSRNVDATSWSCS